MVLFVIKFIFFTYGRRASLCFGNSVAIVGSFSGSALLSPMGMRLRSVCSNSMLTCSSLLFFASRGCDSY